MSRLLGRRPGILVLAASLAGAAIGCHGPVALDPPVLPHFYDSDADLGTLQLNPVLDRRQFIPVLDRFALREHGCIESRDFHRIAPGDLDVTETWLREVQVLKRPLVESFESALAAEVAASKRFRGTAKPRYELSFELEEAPAQIVIREEPDDAFTGMIIPLAAGFIPVPGANIGAIIAAQKAAARAEIECALAGTATLRRDGVVVFTKHLEAVEKGKTHALAERKLLARLLETAMSKVAHQAVADAVRSLDSPEGLRPDETGRARR